VPLTAFLQRSGISIHNIRHVAVDSRKVKQGDLFFALPGARCDGHQFLQEVAQKGAAGAIINRNFTGSIPEELPVFQVKDPLKTLQNLARKRIEHIHPKIIAITGSYGKTTTKEFIACMLSPYYKTAFTSGNHNSKIGMPMSILNELKPDHTHLIVEMGMEQKGEIAYLTQIAPPDIALVTAIGTAHIKNFKSIEEIAQAKAEIFSHSNTSTCLFNIATPYSTVLGSAARGSIRAFSANSSKNAFWVLHKNDEQYFINEDGTHIALPKLSLSSPHLYENILAAIAACRSVGLEWEQIAHQLPSLQVPSGRSNLIEHNGILYINDSYNASEAPMQAALNHLFTYTSKRRVAVIGQMTGLESLSKETHERIGEYALQNVDQLYCLGNDCEPIVEIWKQAKKPCFWTCSLDELISQLKLELKRDDVVLIKGSRGNNMEKILETLTSENPA